MAVEDALSTARHLGADHVIYAFSPDNPPALAVDPGDTIVVETRDAYDRQFVGTPDLDRYLRERRSRPSNPATGPIYVNGVEPSDGLDVTIQSIELADTGYVAAVPGIGVLGDTEVVPRVSAFEVRRDGLWYEGRIRLPLRRMVGVIGVAPRTGAVPCLQLGYHGGNLDFNDVADGTTLHFPVHAPGALLALGDVHATMGFCEVHSGVNIDARVTLRVERARRPGWERPWFETKREVMTIGVEEKLDNAIHEATLGMVKLLQRELGVTYTEAIVLAGASCDIRLGQAARFGVKVSAYAAFPRAVLGPAG